MAKRERAITCTFCDKVLTDKTAGFACQHFVHGKELTYEAGPQEPGKCPDTACTACAIAYDAANDDPEVLDEMNVHVICLRCWKDRARRHVRTEKKDRKRGWAIVPRDTHAALQGVSMKVAASVEKGGFVKLVFIPIPSRGRDEFEMMWVKITSLLADGSYKGKLANDPKIFDKKLLASGTPVAFDEGHIVAVLVG
jgi:hypothetical protein